MLRACLYMLLVLIVIGLSPSDAQAHAGMASEETSTESAGAEPAVPQTPAAPTSRRSPHDHLPGGAGCVTAAGCGGAGSVAAEMPGILVPASVATASSPAVMQAPRSIDLPLDDRPPRPM